MPSGWFAPFRDGEHAQVVVGVGGDEQDFIDLCRAGAVAVPSRNEVAFLVAVSYTHLTPKKSELTKDNMRRYETS